MFKKEAEKYTEKLPFVFETELVRKIVRMFCKNTFEDAAEFGYNKANEWHFVKDGDLPKETEMLLSDNLILITQMKGTKLRNISLGYYNFSTKEFIYPHIEGIIDVIAWKEIVLPELDEKEMKN